MSGFCDSRVRHRIGASFGYSLIELMIATGILTVVCGTVLSGILQLTRVADTVANRSEMHSGVRNATEFLQQEVGQAGHLGMPSGKSLGTAVAAGNATVTILPNTTGMFVGQRVVVGPGVTGVAGFAEEPVTITAVNSATQITAVFTKDHALNAPILSYGGFRDGIVPSNVPNGSTSSLMKIYGDLRANGTLQYAEYWCDTAGGNLSRRAIDIPAPNAAAAVKPAWTVSHVLLNNVTANPADADGTVPPCFTYQQKSINGATFVVNVAVTLTVQTEDKDPITGAVQTETKALLNVSPRNVFNVWQLVSQDLTDYSQPMPAHVAALLP